MTLSNTLESVRNSPRETEPVAKEMGRGHSSFLVSLERPEHYRPIIYEERKWRLPEILESIDQGSPKLVVVVSRWQGMDPHEHSFEIAGDYHILAIALKTSRFSLRLGMRSFPHQDVIPGVIQITPPGLMARVVHSLPYDTLHLHIPNLLLMECFEWSHGRWPTDGVTLRDPLPARDELLEKLGTSLVSVAEADDPNGYLSADFLCLAIVTRLLRHYGDMARPTARKTTALPKWRLKHAIEFIETHLDSPMALADVAGAAGLSRMHFAAQFRAATGVRPHEYVLRRRVEKAQTMLAHTDTPIADLALAVT